MKYRNININYHCKIVLPVSNFQTIEYVLILHLDREPISGPIKMTIYLVLDWFS